MGKAAELIEQIKNNSLVVLSSYSTTSPKNIDDIVFKEMFEALKNNISVKEVKLNSGRIDDARAIIIAETLKINKNIKRIELDSYCKITGKGATAIVDALKDSQIINFSFRRQYDKIEAKFFAKIFENCKLLESLELCIAEIDVVTAEIFAKGISKHNSIQYINFNNCVKTSDVALILLDAIERNKSLSWVYISAYRDKDENKLINNRICEISKNNGLFVRNDTAGKADPLVEKYNYRNLVFLENVASSVIKEVVVSNKTVLFSDNFSSIKWLKLYQKFGKTAIFEEIFWLLPVDKRQILTESYIDIVDDYIQKKYFYITGVNKAISMGASIDDSIPLTWLPKELWKYILSFLGKDNLWAVKYLKATEKAEIKQIAHEIDEAFVNLHDQDAEHCPLVGNSNNN